MQLKNHVKDNAIAHHLYDVNLMDMHIVDVVLKFFLEFLWLCSLKMLKLFLVCQAYAFIITVSQEIKANSGAINGERHQSACHVQDAINTIIPSVEQQLKACATTIAKAVTGKV